MPDFFLYQKTRISTSISSFPCQVRGILDIKSSKNELQSLLRPHLSPAWLRIPFGQGHRCVEWLVYWVGGPHAAGSRLYIVNLAYTQHIATVQTRSGELKQLPYLLILQSFSYFAFRFFASLCATKHCPPCCDYIFYLYLAQHRILSNVTVLSVVL